jgi:hypothetical protein
LLHMSMAFWMLYAGWLICIYKWISHLLSIIQITVRPDAPGRITSI